jgi:hypothetical protein
VSDIADPGKHSCDAPLTGGWPWLWSARGVWLGAIAFAVSLLGTELLDRESLRLWAVLFLLGAGALAVLAWRDSQWSAAFPTDRGSGFAYAQLGVGK